MPGWRVCPRRRVLQLGLTSNNTSHVTHLAFPAGGLGQLLPAAPARAASQERQVRLTLQLSSPQLCTHKGCPSVSTGNSHALVLHTSFSPSRLQPQVPVQLACQVVSAALFPLSLQGHGRHSRGPSGVCLAAGAAPCAACHARRCRTAQRRVAPREQRCHPAGTHGRGAGGK